MHFYGTDFIVYFTKKIYICFNFKLLCNEYSILIGLHLLASYDCLFSIMEALDSKPKSVLKKTGKKSGGCGKRVTFCSSKKIYTDDGPPIVVNLVSKDEFQDAKEIEVLKSLCIETEVLQDYSLYREVLSPTLFEWFENDQHSLIPSFDIHDADDPEEFFVHKVVYDAQAIQEDNESIQSLHDEVEDASVYSSPGDLDDCQEFVVHQVFQDFTDSVPDSTEQDHPLSDMLEQETFVEVAKDGDEKNAKSQENHALSVENILQHDKLTQESVRSTSVCGMLDLPVNPCISPKEFVLSPPLQELSLEKLVISDPSNSFWSIDISPLSSIHETDSESSNISSEDTMIMMTTEESRKNEEHIRESLLHFQFMQKSKDVSKTQLKYEELEYKDKQLSLVVEDRLPLIDTKCTLSGMTSEHSMQLTSCIDSGSETKELNATASPEHQTTSDYSDGLNDVQHSRQIVETNANIESSSPSCSVERSCETKFHSTTTSFNEVKNPLPLSDFKKNNYWDKTLSSVEIPSDVREWKIARNSIAEAKIERPMTPKEQGSASDSAEGKISASGDKECVENDCLAATQSKSHMVVTKEIKETSLKIYASDELEHFAHQCTDRIDRIRKRYSMSEKVRCSPGEKSVRGIRPRFGSTADILKQIQTPSYPPMMSFSGGTSHSSLPYFNSGKLGNTLVHDRRWSSPHLAYDMKNVKHDFSQTYSQQLPCYVYDSSACPNDKSNEIFPDNAQSLYCHHVDPQQIASCDFPLLNERGIPEGASSETICEHMLPEHLCCQSNDEGVVYYSMKV